MDTSSVLSQTPLFAGLDQATVQRLAALVEPVELHSGQHLFTAGEPSDHFYIVVNGRLRLRESDTTLNYAGRLQAVGEIGVLSGDPRSLDAHAIRDSLLLRIARQPFLDFLEAHPRALMAVTRLAVGRLKKTQGQQRRAATGGERAFAVIPAAPGMPVTTLAEALVRQLRGWPHARLVTAAHVNAELGPGAAQTRPDDREGSARLMSWLNELETQHRYLVYAADGEFTAWAWALRCMRQADRVLILADAAYPPAEVWVLSQARQSGLLAPVELVLLRGMSDPSPHTAGWRAATGARAHYFVHPWFQDELAALARQVTGRGLGLVLGGGGARGFAHIGLVRALEQLHIPVDVMGGTSMGAFMSALLAMGCDSLEMIQIARETFVRTNFLNDYVFPRVSLIRGRRFRTRLMHVFGDRLIEDLRRTYFSVSSNLTTGATVAHESGPLALWVGSSMAVPGVAPPIAYEGDLLCDGGVVDNLPTDIMQNLERGSILACSVSAEGDLRARGYGIGSPDPDALLLRWSGTDKRPSLAEIISRTAMLSASTTGAREAAERADLYIRMPVQSFGMFDWTRLDELVERGYRHALETLAPLRDTLLNHAAASSPTTKP